VVERDWTKENKQTIDAIVEQTDCGHVAGRAELVTRVKEKGMSSSESVAGSLSGVNGTLPMYVSMSVNRLTVPTLNRNRYPYCDWFVNVNHCPYDYIHRPLKIASFVISIASALLVAAYLGLRACRGRPVLIHNGRIVSLDGFLVGVAISMVCTRVNRSFKHHGTLIVLA